MRIFKICLRLITVVILILIIPSCMLEGDEESNDGELINWMSDDKIIFRNGKFILRNTSNGIAVYTDNMLVGEFDDFYTLKYIDASNTVCENHILVEKNTANLYRLYTISEETIMDLECDYHSYAIHDDYIVLDNYLYDGHLDKIGVAYGEVESITSLNDGGVVTFKDNNGEVYSYFRVKSVNKPNEENAISYRDNYYNHGMNSEDEYIIVGGKEYHKTREQYFEIPSEMYVNNTSSICTEIGTVVFLYYKDNDVTDFYVREIKPIQTETSSTYYLSIDYPITSVIGGARFNQYDEYLCDKLPQIKWLVGTDNKFHAFFGGLHEVCGGKFLQFGTFNDSLVPRHTIFDENLKVVDAFDALAILQDSTFVGKPVGKNEIVLYGKDGTIKSTAKYEKVLTLGQYGGAVVRGTQVQFVDLNGTILAFVDGYKSTFELDKQRSILDGPEGKYHVVFHDLENGDEIDYWFDPQTGETGVIVLNHYSEIDLEQIYEEYIEEYTFFPMSLINYIGSEEFFGWVEDSEPYVIDEDGEIIPQNVINCLRYFNITQKEFEHLYYTNDYYSLIYDIDIMYTGTQDEIHAYFTDFEKRQEEHDKRINILDNKMAFRRNISNWTTDENVIRKYKEIPITAWTFTDIIYDANIPREDVEAIFTSTETYDTVTGKAKFNHYDIDQIYKSVDEMNNSNVMATEFASLGASEHYCQSVVFFENQLIDTFETNIIPSDVKH